MRCRVVCVENMEPSEGLLTGVALHETLHASGIYETMNPHSSTVHLAPILSAIRFQNRVKNARITSVLDVGCGTGVGVKALWSLNFIASGVDVSATAIKTANERYVKDRSNSQCVLHNCFLVGDVAKIPFPSRAFDAVMAAGLLEHVAPKYVSSAISELTRVTRQYIFLQIAMQPTLPSLTRLRLPAKGNVTASEHLIRNFRGRAQEPIEVNLKPQLYWIDLFHNRGYVFEKNTPLPNWGCCAFVLRRNATAQFRKLRIRASSPGVKILRPISSVHYHKAK